MGCTIKERYMGCPNYNIIKYRWLLYPLLIIIFWPLTMAVPRNKKNNEKDIVYKYIRRVEIWSRIAGIYQRGKSNKDRQHNDQMKKDKTPHRK